MDITTIKDILQLDDGKDRLNVLIDHGLTDCEGYLCFLINEDGCIRLLRDISDLESIGVMRVAEVFLKNKLLDAGED